MSWLYAPLTTELLFVIKNSKTSWYWRKYIYISKCSEFSEEEKRIVQIKLIFFSIDELYSSYVSCNVKAIDVKKCSLICLAILLISINSSYQSSLIYFTFHRPMFLSFWFDWYNQLGIRYLSHRSTRPHSHNGSLCVWHNLPVLF